MDAVLANATVVQPPSAAVTGLRLAVPENYALNDLDAPVSAAFERAITRLSRAGASVVRLRIPALDEVPVVAAKANVAAAEAYAWHRPLLATKAALYDPLIRSRIESEATVSAADYLDVLSGRLVLINHLDVQTREIDALLMPTVPILPPRASDLDDETVYNRLDGLVLRNTLLANAFDRCAISMPCHRPSEPPVGLMLIGETMGDRRLFQIALAVEAAIA